MVSKKDSKGDFVPMRRQRSDRFRRMLITRSDDGYFDRNPDFEVWQFVEDYFFTGTSPFTVSRDDPRPRVEPEAKTCDGGMLPSTRLEARCHII